MAAAECGEQQQNGAAAVEDRHFHSLSTQLACAVATQEPTWSARHPGRVVPGCLGKASLRNPSRSDRQRQGPSALARARSGTAPLPTTRTRRRLLLLLIDNRDGSNFFE